jgi:hypothetical protein
MNQTEHWRNVNPHKRQAQRQLLGPLLKATRKEGRELRVLCMPGSSAWDFDYFLASGAVAHIVGIERDEVIAEDLRRRYPQENVEVVNTSVVEFLMETDQRFDLIYLDYCCPFGLSEAQDLEILMERRLLYDRGHCALAYHNAREGAAVGVLHTRMLQELERFLVLGEMSSDQVRCAAVNGLIARNRRCARFSSGDYYIFYPVKQWYRYSTRNGSMLTGMLRYAEPSYCPKTAREMVSDRWAVQGHCAIRDVRVDTWQGRGAINRWERSLGRTGTRAPVHQWALEFYRTHHRAPRAKEVIASGLLSSPQSWSDELRSLGLCPLWGTSVDDIRGELTRIYERDGAVTVPLLIRAGLLLEKSPNKVASNALKTYARSAIPAFSLLLQEMQLPHVLETPMQERHFRDLEQWVDILAKEGSAGWRHRGLYNTMRRRGFAAYEDASKELRRLRAEREKTLALRPPDAEE